MSRASYLIRAIISYLQKFTIILRQLYINRETDNLDNSSRASKLKSKKSWAKFAMLAIGWWLQAEEHKQTEMKCISPMVEMNVCEWNNVKWKNDSQTARWHTDGGLDINRRILVRARKLQSCRDQMKLEWLFLFDDIK